MTLVVHRLGIIAPPLAQNKAPDGGLGLLVRFLAVGCGLNKTPDGWLGCLVRFLAVGCGLNKSPGGGMGVCWCASSPLAAG